MTNAVTNNNNWFVQDINRSQSRQMDFKGDHNLNDKMRLTGRYSFAPNSGTPANLLGAGNPAYTFNDGPTRTKTTSVVADFTRTENASTVWTFRYGLIYSDFHRDAMAAFDLTALGLGVRHGSGTAAEVVENVEPSERRRTLGPSPASNGGGTT